MAAGSAKTGCTSSHPPHQRGWALWRCPLCHSPLRRDLAAPDALPDCGLLHSDDQLACANLECQFAGLGNYVARLVATAGCNKTCPACKSKGHTLAGAACKTCRGKGYVACKRAAKVADPPTPDRDPHP